MQPIPLYVQVDEIALQPSSDSIVVGRSPQVVATQALFFHVQVPKPVLTFAFVQTVAPEDV